MKSTDPEEISEKLLKYWEADTGVDGFPFIIENIDGIDPYNPLIHDDTLLVPNRELNQYEFANLRNNSMNLIFEIYEDILFEEAKKQAEILRERHRDIEPELEVPRIKIKGSVEYNPLIAGMVCYPWDNKLNVSPHVVEFIDLDGNFKEVNNDEIFYNLHIDDALRHELAHTLHFEIMKNMNKNIENPFAEEALAMYEGVKDGHQPLPKVNNPWLIPLFWEKFIEFDEESGYKIDEEMPHKYALHLSLLTEESFKGTENPELHTRRRLRTLGIDEEIEKLNNNNLLRLNRPSYMKTLEAAYNTLKDENREDAEEVLKDYEPNIEYIQDNINGLQNYYYAIALSQTYENLFGPSTVAKELKRRADVRQDKIEFGML
ncbi:MAG: hypothetical protein ABEK17_01955 [Candidatus Aenigmatarchaeota archaeon]